MEAIKYFVTFGNLILAAILIWYALKRTTYKGEKVVSFSVSMLSIASVVLIWIGM